MRVLMINVVCGIRSTGRICTDLAIALEKQGHEVKIAYGREEVPEQFQKYAVRIGSELDVKLHGVKARLFDGTGFGSKHATKKFITWVKKYDPDVIHLHNIHGYYINIEVLFRYLRICRKTVIWTLHDCWAFTGHCTYFDYIGCNKWKYRCKYCPQKGEYPVCIGVDRAEKNYMKKKMLFTGIKNLVIVTPSSWLERLVKQSFLSEYNVKIIHNGIDTKVFRPTNGDLREKLGLNDKKIVLGVASNWDKRKGLHFFIELCDLLPDEYRIVLIGLSKKQIDALPKGIIGIERINNIQELAALYTTADVFVNPTLEDNYPTTNLESIACGTPVVTFNTGGSVESASLYGIITYENNSMELAKAIEKIGYLEKNNLRDVLSKKYMSEAYMNLYETLK